MKNRILIMTVVLGMLTLGLTAQTVITIEKGSKQFRVISSDAHAYIWYVNGAVVPGDDSASYHQLWNAGSTYWLAVAGLNADGCSGDSFSVIVKVKQDINIGGPQINWSNASPYNYCYNNLFNLQTDSVPVDINLSGYTLSKGEKYQIIYSLDKIVQPTKTFGRADTSFKIAAKSVSTGIHNLEFVKLLYGINLSQVVDYSTGSLPPDLAIQMNLKPILDNIQYPLSPIAGNICASTQNALYSISGDLNIKYSWSLSGGGTIVSNTNVGSVYIDWGSISGIYKLSVYGEKNGCITDTKTLNVTVHSNPITYLGGDRAICQGDHYTFDAGGGSTSYLWSDGSTDRYLTVNQPGMLWVTAKNSMGCISSDTAHLVVHPLPLVKLGKDTMICGNLGLELNARNDGAFYNWLVIDNEGTKTATTQTIQVTSDPKRIYLSVTDENNCSNNDSIKITQCNFNEWYNTIPKAFTPNGDGINDCWHIPGLTNYPNSSVEVYDRWGRLVFRSAKAYADCWDGKDISGKVVPMDSYFYIISFNAGIEPVSGYITLIR